jgi:hypothetical protein
MKRTPRRLEKKHPATPQKRRAVSKAVTAWACAETSANMKRDWHFYFGKGTNKPHSRVPGFLSAKQKKAPRKGPAE